MKYLIEFDRIGRNHLPAPLVVNCGNHHELLALIERHARRHGNLISADIDITIDMTTGRGSIAAGFHTAGTFVVAELPLPTVTVPNVY